MSERSNVLTQMIEELQRVNSIPPSGGGTGADDFMPELAARASREWGSVKYVWALYTEDGVVTAKEGIATAEMVRALACPPFSEGTKL